MNHFGWLAIFRLGLVQSALGAIVVLTTSTLNRVMVVELALPALLPGILVGLHYAVQISRPRMGHGSDVGGRSTPWIIGGMAVLGLGGLLGAIATAWMATHPVAGIATAVIAFVMVGLGVGDGLLFMVLCASASYIAVPAAMRMTVPNANPSLYITTALGLTFPFNVVVGIPLYMALVQRFIPVA